jgi:pyrrolidone-carboxylate peptidase
LFKCPSLFVLALFTLPVQRLSLPSDIGWAADNVQIDLSLPLEAPRCTSMPLKEVLDDLKKQGFNVELSNDPGKSICWFLCLLFEDLQGTSTHMLSIPFQSLPDSMFNITSKCHLPHQDYFFVLLSH